ncbi:hypothetical protein N9B73_09705 [Verrucomicrobiales bacterium]|nr:hypothetical protein [Verrucomicrobiales bacterium]
MIHTICHSKIHSLFTETELARTYSTIEALRENAEMVKLVKWISKRPPDFKSKNRAPKD